MTCKYLYKGQGVIAVRLSLAFSVVLHSTRFVAVCLLRVCFLFVFVLALLGTLPVFLALLGSQPVFLLFVLCVVCCLGLRAHGSVHGKPSGSLSAGPYY